MKRYTWFIALGFLIVGLVTILIPTQEVIAGQTEVGMAEGINQAMEMD